MTDASRYSPTPAGHQKSIGAGTTASRQEPLEPYAGPSGAVRARPSGEALRPTPFVPRPFRSQPREHTSDDVFPSVTADVVHEQRALATEADAKATLAAGQHELPWIDAYLDDTGAAQPTAPTGETSSEGQVPAAVNQAPNIETPALTSAEDAAQVLESLSRQLRDGSLSIVGFVPGSGEAAALAATLTAVLGRGR